MLQQPESANGLGLPHLLCIADVPVEASYHGSALLFRLLQDWPVERLHVIESNLLRSQPTRRLPGVGYSELHVGNQRLLHTRFAPWYAAFMMSGARRRCGAISRLDIGFKPDAVLSVTHGFSWLVAADYAHQRSLPLHLVCHDDLPRSAILPRLFAPWLERTFGRVYRQATSRLCVSPFMIEEYRRRYGVEGELLYPSRASDAPCFDEPPSRIRGCDAPFTVAFAGSVNSPGYVRALGALAKALQAVGGTLLIYGPLTEESGRRVGLEYANIVFKGTVPSGQLITRLRDEAHALFVPMSFEPADASNMRMGFPSKLTDCTAVGLPLLTYGPMYCSLIRWARENPGVAEVVDSEDPAQLEAAVGRLATKPSHRVAMGLKALEVGNRFFGYETGRRVFQEALRGSPLEKSNPIQNSVLP